ncbi:MAG: nicotinate-nucleotide--dimethylbenzimidazole phosphoribosyltransferase [Terracidiphilus sp.]
MKQTLPASLADVVASIKRCDERYGAEARNRLNNLTKPIGSLGRLEALAAQMFSIFSGNIPLPLRRGAYVFAADHGVTAEGVSAYPREVTAQMVRNFLNGGAAINVLAKLNGAELTVVDVGVDAEFEDAPGLERAKVRRGSRNMRREPALSREELAAAIEVGIRMASRAGEKGQHLVAVGEMGIGNTTSASAIASLVTRLPLGEVTGRGAGLDVAGRNRKLNIVRRSLKEHFDGATESPEPLEILRCVGGLEIAAMTGFILSAAARRMAVVCDGFISTAAAALAFNIAPEVKDYLLAGHCSEEPGHRHLLKHIGLSPILNLGMRLGEGTGAVLAMPLIESSVRIFAEMATFSSAGVSRVSK